MWGAVIVAPLSSRILGADMPDTSRKNDAKVKIWIKIS